MLTHYSAVREVATRIAGAIDRSVVALDRGRVEHEPAMTDRMLGAIEESIHDFSSKGITWSAKTLTDRGRGSQESRYGADFMGVLDINLPDFRVQKGFLAQAKLQRHGSLGDLDELKEQCRKMLVLSQSSYVFVYGESRVIVLPATSVVACQGDPLEVYSRSAQRFFEEHLQCFIGDTDIRVPSPDQLTSLREQYEARSAILLLAAPTPTVDLVT